MHLCYESHDPFTGITDQVFYEHPAEDGKPGKLHFKKLQDVEHILAMNKVQRNEGGKRPSYNDSDGFHHVARIPLIVIEQWVREGFNWYESTDAERKAKLNDPAYAYLKVRDGRL